MSSDSSNNAGLSRALSSLNIGDGEINNEKREAADNIITATILCAACGKEGGDNMNTCNKCDLVVYCNAACKKKHRPKHKKKCEKRAAEVYDVKLFKEPPSPDECPICMLPPPLYEDHMGMTFHSCCGKLICNGCIDAMAETGGKNMELCPFCKTPPARSRDSEVKRVQKLMEKGNANAFYYHAGCYGLGKLGLPQNWVRANELYLKAGQLGCAEAYCTLAVAYQFGNGVEIDTKKAKYYWELAAMMGIVDARYGLGCMEYNAGNHERAYKHCLIAASAGYKPSLDAVKKGYMAGHVTKEQYAITLREYQKIQDETKSDARDKARAVHNQIRHG